MAPKKKKSHKETLPAPSTLPDGHATYYIANWSVLQSIENLTELSTAIVAAHTEEDRTVRPIPRTNVLMLPSTLQIVAEDYEDMKDDFLDIVVSNNMHLEGVSRKVTAEHTKLCKDWKQVIPETATDAPPAASLVAAPVEGEEVSVEGKGSPVAESSALPPEAADPDIEANPLDGVSVFFGSDFSAQDVQLHGDIRVLGVLPQIVVKPILPEPPKRTEETDRKGGKGPKGRRGSKTSRRKKAVKLTPEQIEEIERKRKEEEEEFLKKTEEAIALAASQEDYLMTFAHPDKWSSVVVSNVTFTGPVVVTRTHVQFLNCRFVSSHLTKPQLTISQYCRVTCTKCSFDAPTFCGLYALPAAQISAKKCLFSGIPQEELFRLESVHNAAAAQSSADDVQLQDDGEEEEYQENEAATNGVNSAVTGEVTLSPQLEARYEEVRASAPSAVGIYGDCAKVMVDTCRFLFLGTGVRLQGRYNFAPHVEVKKRQAKSSAPMTILNSYMFYVFSTAISLDARDVLLRKNQIADCGYYALDCRSSRCGDVSVYHNLFGIQAQVRIRAGAQVQLMHNTIQSLTMNDNKRDNPCLQPTY